MTTPQETDGTELAALARRILGAIDRGELTAPRRLVRLLEALVGVAEGEPPDPDDHFLT